MEVSSYNLRSIFMRSSVVLAFAIQNISWSDYNYGRAKVLQSEEFRRKQRPLLSAWQAATHPN